MKQNVQEYSRNFVIAMVAYAILVFISAWLLEQVTEVPWSYLVAILPMLPLLFGLRAYLRYLGQLDELQRHIQLQAISFAAGMTGIITTTYGFLEGAGLPHLSYIPIFPLLILLWGLAAAVLRRRYQ